MKHILDNLDADGINVRISGEEDYERLAHAINQHATKHHVFPWDKYAFENDGGEYVNVFKDGDGQVVLLPQMDGSSQSTMHIDELLNNHLPDTFHIPTDELTVEQKKHILQILEDHTDILWSGDTKPTEFNESIEDWRVLTFNILGNGTLTWGRVFEFFRGTRITYHELCEMYGDIPNHRKAYLYRGGSAYNNMRMNRILEGLPDGSSSATHMHYDATKKAFTIEDNYPVKPAITKMRDNQSLMTKAINTYKKLTRPQETKAEIQAGLRHEDGKLNYQEVCPFVIEYLYETDEKFRKRIQEAAEIIIEGKE